MFALQVGDLFRVFDFIVCKILGLFHLALLWGCFLFLKYNYRNEAFVCIEKSLLHIEPNMV